MSGTEQEFRIGPYMTIILAATIAFTLSNLYLGPPTKSGALNCSGQGCIIAGFASLVGILLVLTGCIGIYRGLVRAGYIHAGRSLSLPQLGSAQEDEMILSLARQSLAKTRRRRWRRPVEAVYWQEHLAWNWCRFTRRRMRLEGIILSSDLRGRLGEQDWRNLLTYYFPGKWRLPTRVGLELIFSVIAPVIFLAITTGAVQLVYGFTWGNLVGRTLGPSVSLLTFILLFNGAKRGFLQEDRSKARTIGTQPLLNLFQKIDQLGLATVGRGKRRTGLLAFLWPMPNIIERIENLRSGLPLQLKP